MSWPLSLPTGNDTRTPTTSVLGRISCLPLRFKLFLKGASLKCPVETAVATLVSRGLMTIFGNAWGSANAL